MNDKTARRLNFGAGPATLPLEILVEAQEELLNWRGKGLSILELGHRTPDFMELLQETEASLRRLLAIPDNYKVLFIAGPARMHFSMVPLNLLNAGRKGAYLVSGVWSSMALKEAQRLKNAYCAASAEADQYRSIPAFSPANLQEETDFLYFTPNETINGTRFARPPEQEELPLVADMTSCLLTEPVNIQDYGLIFAGAQKNIANAGLNIVIMREELAKATENLPTMMDYRTWIKHQSLYATPPTFNCYLASKMFAWIEARGGVSSMYQINKQKAKKLYDYIDNSSFYICPVEKNARSLVNICFKTKAQQMDERFVKEAVASGFLGLKGHQLAGGLRASLYNAMPLEAVESLIQFMDDFARKVV